ncbi:glycosyltransferase [Candidatus Pacearchaeota archaeon]|nr:glycosyltransferase [Candidatus Pacearchaeota archaeon]
MNRLNLCIVMPAHNEEQRISKTLESYGKLFSKLRKNKKIRKIEILVVINNTQDRTEEIVKKVRRKYKNIEYLNFKEGGKGFAIIQGFKEACRQDWDLIGFVDADMSTSAEEYFNLISKIENYDGVIASRYLKKSVVTPKQSFLRVMASRVFNFLIRSMFFMPYTDTQCGAKIFRKDAIKSVLPELGITQWSFDIDLLYRLRKKGFKIKEIPTVWADAEKSKLRLGKASMQMFLSIVQLRIINSKFRRLISPVKPVIGILWRKVK